MSTVVSRRDFGPEGFRWLTLTQILWKDPTGKLRKWESAERTTRKGPVDAVAMIVHVTGGGGPPRVILEKQFRPPQDNYVIEMPAGLIDDGETAREAAVRELKEETGYTGTVGRTSSVCYSDPGMTNANMVFVDMHVDADAPENANVRPELEEGEFIDVFMLPRRGLYNALLALQKGDGVDVDARLLMYAAGLDDGAAAAGTSQQAAAAGTITAEPSGAVGGKGSGAAVSSHDTGQELSDSRGGTPPPGGNGSGPASAVGGFLRRVGSRGLLSPNSRAGSAGTPPRPPPPVEVSMLRPDSFASLRGLDGDASEAAFEFGHPGETHPQDSSKGPMPILMRTDELKAAGIESVRIVPRGTLRWRRFDRTMLAVCGAGIVAGICLSQLAAGMVLAVGLNYHPSHRLSFRGRL